MSNQDFISVLYPGCNSHTNPHMPSTQHSSLCSDVNVKPLWFCLLMSVLHLVKADSAVLLWRVLHLVKSHYYGNVRVLEIMARWEQLDCLWHNNPTLSVSSASSLYCMFPTLPSLYLAVSLPDSPLLLIEKQLCFFFSWDTCSLCSDFVIKIKHYCTRAFAVATFQQC